LSGVLGPCLRDGHRLGVKSQRAALGPHCYAQRLRGCLPGLAPVAPRVGLASRAMATEPLILLANDDGYSSRGLRALRQALQRIGRVVVCAPHTEQSSTSHAITLTRPLRLLQHEPGVFSLDGTPADCVYVSLCAGTRVLERTPDLVVSGINHGPNLGHDVFYSGTIAAAREGALRGLPALALSADSATDFERAAEVGATLARALLADGATHGRRGERGVLLNANFPPGTSWPVVPTRLGVRRYDNRIEFRRDPRGGEYLWVGGTGVEHEGPEGTDTAAFDAGHVGLTPLSLELWSAADTPCAERVVALASAGS
jgi:5'-nucleotidase